MSEVPYTWRPEANVCPLCHGTGMVVLHKQGDPAPPIPGCTFTSTVYELCACRITAGRIYPVIEDK